MNNTDYEREYLIDSVYIKEDEYFGIIQLNEEINKERLPAIIKVITPYNHPNWVKPETEKIENYERTKSKKKDISISNTPKLPF